MSNSQYELVEKLKRYWPHDDSPGYTDYPENDIATHRSLAKWQGRCGIAFFVLALVAYQQTGRVLTILPALILAALMFWAADRTRLQALEWELQLVKEGSA